MAGMKACHFDRHATCVAWHMMAPRAIGLTLGEMTSKNRREFKHDSMEGTHLRDPSQGPTEMTSK